MAIAEVHAPCRLYLFEILAVFDIIQIYPFLLKKNIDGWTFGVPYYVGPIKNIAFNYLDQCVGHTHLNKLL
jgi:hypothetical protein